MIIYPSPYDRRYHALPLPAEPTTERAERKKKKPYQAMEPQTGSNTQPAVPQDLIQALAIAKKAVATFNLPHNVFHPPSEKKCKEDFVFDRADGQSWMDPGELLELGDFFVQYRENLEPRT